MAETIPTPAGGPRYFSIVIAGVMTPGMHHPLWYKLIGCISDKESIEAMGRISITPDIAQFQTAEQGGIRVICGRDRWEIAVWNEEERPRILEIASRVFEKLFESPVSGFAFSSMADLDTEVARVDPLLGELAQSTGLGFIGHGQSTCGFEFSSENAEHAIRVIVRNSAVRDSKVWVSYSSQYTIRPSPTGYMVLGPELARYFGPHWEDAKAMGQRVVARINKMKGVSNGIHRAD